MSEKLNKKGLERLWHKILLLADCIQGKISALEKSMPEQAKNGKLTIQKNGTTVETFTANQSGDTTANIVIPNVINSCAVTQKGQMALDAIEKNATIEGTLAHQIAQANSNLDSITFIDIGHADFTNLQNVVTFTLGTLSKGKYLIYYFGKFVTPVTKGLDCGIFGGVGQIEETRAVLNNSSGINAIGYINSPSEITITCRAFADGIANRGYVRASALRLK